ncbi:MAG: hypothetical protein E7497_07095 [Ruminococcus sp.]|nr:hypothetical protein [Ruminococcus sp.]
MLKKIKSERYVWIDVTFTLLALELMAYFYYGIRTLVTAGICIAVSLIAELIFLRFTHRKFTADDLTCTSDALIAALMVPAVIDYKIPAIACVFAVIAAKNIFGGRRNMIFSPAAVAYVFILASWKKELLSYPAPHDKADILDSAAELTNSATYVFNHTGSMNYTDFELLLGNFSGPIGAVSILLLIVAAVILILRRDISWGAFVGTVAGTGFMAYFCPIASNSILSVKYVFATNMILFAAIYIISDLRIAPKRNYYAFFYGFFIAISSYVLMITTGQENIIVIMSVLFTPLSLAFKNLQKRIDNEKLLEAEAAAEAVLEAEVTAAEEAVAETEDKADIEAVETEGTENSEEEVSEEEAISSDDESEEAEAVTEEVPSDTETEQEEPAAEEEKAEGDDSDE